MRSRAARTCTTPTASSAMATSGRGDGPSAAYLTPHPRDFTSAKYKIRSTETRQRADRRRSDAVGASGSVRHRDAGVGPHPVGCRDRRRRRVHQGAVAAVRDRAQTGDRRRRRFRARQRASRADSRPTTSCSAASATAAMAAGPARWRRRSRTSGSSRCGLPISPSRGRSTAAPRPAMCTCGSEPGWPARRCRRSPTPPATVRCGTCPTTSCRWRANPSGR